MLDRCACCLIHKGSLYSYAHLACKQFQIFLTYQREREHLIILSSLQLSLIVIFICCDKAVTYNQSKSTYSIKCPFRWNNTIEANLYYGRFLSNERYFYYNEFRNIKALRKRRYHLVPCLLKLHIFFLSFLIVRIHLLSYLEGMIRWSYERFRNN